MHQMPSQTSQLTFTVRPIYVQRAAYEAQNRAQRDMDTPAQWPRVLRTLEASLLRRRLP